MAKIHFLNVKPGDCTIIQHNSKRLTCIDVCGGNLEVRQQAAAEEMAKGVVQLAVESAGQLGNFNMCARPSNPINYIKTFALGTIYRFILSHPDMDHMDGLKALSDDIGFWNFWDSGARRNPKMEKFYRYNQDDWDFYQKLIKGEAPGIRVAQRLAGAEFAFANKVGEGRTHDGLYILAPNKDLLCDPDENDDVNEASYIIEYRTSAGPMIFAGDAHDASWEFALNKKTWLNGKCSLLLAPHHGRDSGRSYDFLDFLKPKLTIIGCSPSKHIHYKEWSKRGLDILTSNQAGNIVAETHEGYYHVFVENEEFAQKYGSNADIKNSQNYSLYKTVVI
ncbi:hypothetical protein LJR118_000626 [Acidovorax sp. LjRoot118]|uniref:ComEC/Rec2 family competence protein n=1 Tax=Acidovorax sp. LjRoot118 TaxID=3342256 RepID=UPI003ED0BA45